MSGREVIRQDEGPDVHVWTDSAGERWACAAYDHGPFCRLCQRADDVLVGLLDGVRDGQMIARAQPDGSLEFRVTAKGAACAEDLIASDPEMAAFWADLQRNRRRIADALGVEPGQGVALSPVEDRVLGALYDAKGDGEDGVSPAVLAERTGYSLGQVQAALQTLANVGYIGGGGGADG